MCYFLVKKFDQYQTSQQMLCKNLLSTDGNLGLTAERILFFVQMPFFVDMYIYEWTRWYNSSNHFTVIGYIVIRALEASWNDYFYKFCNIYVALVQRILFLNCCSNFADIIFYQQISALLKCEQVVFILIVVKLIIQNMLLLK